MFVVKIKIFFGGDKLLLEQEVNTFLEEKNVHFIGLTSSSKGGKFNSDCTTIVVTYRNKVIKEKPNLKGG